MIYESKIPVAERTTFIAKVRGIASKLSIPPEWLMVVMNSESQLNPKAVNDYGGATGLIQFMPSTAVGLGTSTTALKNMTATQQLDYVYKYYKPYSSRITSYEDLYLITFYPIALGKKETWVFGSEVSNPYARKVAEQNKALDLNNSGYIALWEFKKWINSRIPESIKKELETGGKAFKFALRNKWYILTGLVLSSGIIYLIVKK